MERHRILSTINLFCRVLVITIPLLVALVFIQLLIHDLYFYTPEIPLTRQINLPEKEEKNIEKVEPKKRIDYSVINYLPDGTIHLKYTKDISKSRKDRRVQIQIYDPNFNLIWEGIDDANNIYSDQYLAFSNIMPILNISDDINRFNLDYLGNKLLIIPVHEDMTVCGYWKYNHFINCFEGFDKNKNIIGYCGSDGFVSDKSQVKGFGNLLFTTPRAWYDTNNNGPHVILGTKHEIYEADFGTQIIQSLINLNGKEIKEIGIYNWLDLFQKVTTSDKSTQYRPMIICLTQDDSLFFVLRDPNEIIQTRLPEEFKTKSIRFFATYENIYIRVIDDGLHPPEDIAKDYIANSEWMFHSFENPVTNSDQLYTVDSSGKIKLLNELKWTTPAFPANLVRLYPDKKILKLVSNGSPVFCEFISGFLNRFREYQFMNNIIESNAIVVVLGYSSPFFNPINYFLSILIAGVVFIHALPRRKSWIGLVGWVVFAALFNIVGLLVYLDLNFTPLIKCHQCNKLRGLSTPACPYCGAELSSKSPVGLCIITES